MGRRKIRDREKDKRRKRANEDGKKTREKKQRKKVYDTKKMK